MGVERFNILKTRKLLWNQRPILIKTLTSASRNTEFSTVGERETNVGGFALLSELAQRQTHQAESERKVGGILGSTINPTMARYGAKMRGTPLDAHTRGSQDLPHPPIYYVLEITDSQSAPSLIVTPADSPFCGWGRGHLRMRKKLLASLSLGRPDCSRMRKFARVHVPEQFFFAYARSTRGCMDIRLSSARGGHDLGRSRGRCRFTKDD